MWCTYLQCLLLEKFPLEAGAKDPTQRMIPFLPGTHCNPSLHDMHSSTCCSLKFFTSIPIHCCMVLDLQISAFLITLKDCSNNVCIHVKGTLNTNLCGIPWLAT